MYRIKIRFRDMKREVFFREDYGRVLDRVKECIDFYSRAGVEPEEVTIKYIGDENYVCSDD